MDQRTITITQDGVSATLTVEMAITDDETEQGLMFRQSLSEDRGMLFVFESDQDHGFWMKNTLIALTIAYLDTKGYVFDLHDAKPYDERNIIPSQPYRYALEVNQGWFERHGLGIGARMLE